MTYRLVNFEKVIQYCVTKTRAERYEFRFASLVRVAHELEFYVTIRLEPRRSGVVLEAKF